MKQVLQDLASGATMLVDAPAPMVHRGHLLIRTQRSLISAGTERMLVEFGRASLLQKALQQPERVRQAVDKVRTDGLWATVEAVRSKLDQPLPLGYCNAGVVLEVGPGVTEFKPGDRVASNGPHASIVSVPKNLCARIPQTVDDQDAAFTVLASIALQGIRLAAPTLGETVAVTGLGMIGLLTVQMLRANGCRVLGIDFDARRLELARKFGAVAVDPAAEDPVTHALAMTGGKGVDAVIVTAATDSSEPMSQAARMARKRGRLVLVGVAGLELNRADFYEKELTFQVSCSYGPGRYDPSYEKDGHDYPFGLVRWTEQRNFEAVLDLLAEGRLDVKSLVSHRVAITEAAAAYDALVKDPGALGIVLEYPGVEEPVRRVALGVAPEAFDATRPVCAFIGAGNYASRVLIPAFRSAGAQLHTIVTAGGVSGVVHGEAAQFAEASSDVGATLASPAINTVAIATRHDTHARLVVQALSAGKHVFVEKPLALSVEEIAEVEGAWRARAEQGQSLQVMVGFNRRFAPHIVRMKGLLAPMRAPKSIIITVNAGAIPSEHWTQDPGVGGGRIIGEACHFIDLMRFLAGAPVVSVQARRIGDTSAGAVTEDKAVVTLGFADGSFGTVHYLANGSNEFPKERIEVFCEGRVLQLDNFRVLRGFGWPAFRRMRRWRQDKGQAECVRTFLAAVAAGGPAPIPFDEVLEVARVTVEAATLIRRQ